MRGFFSRMNPTLRGFLILIAIAVVILVLQLESTLVATHTEIVGRILGTDAGYLLASIVTIEARNGTVLASLGGATELSDLLVYNEADALTPAGG